MTLSLLRTSACLGLAVLGTVVQSISITGIPEQVPFHIDAGIQAPASCIPKAEGSEPITVFVTSVTQPYIQGYKKRDWEGTLWGPDSQPNIKNTLWVYNENTWDVMHGRPALKQSEVPVADCFFDVFDAAPGLLELVSDKGRIDDFYRIPGVRGLSDRIMDGKALVRKLAAISHAAAQLPDGALLVWVDVDTRVDERELDQRWYDFVMSRDITYIAESLCRSEVAGVKSVEELPPYCLDYRVESGVMAIRVSPTMRNFFHSALEWYDGRMLDLARECLQTEAPPDKCTGAKGTWRRNNIGLNDIYVLAQVLHDTQGLKHGWFATERQTCEGGAHKIDVGKHAGSSMPWLGQCAPCVNDGAGELVTPFYLEEYILHRKGGIGVMAMQHAGRDEKMQNTDPEMTLPAEHGQQVDPRPACGDFRLNPKCVHSIECEEDGATTAALYPDYAVPKKFL